jgi:murein DD-endopeptidase MepM/ murein hydrolase activator NlpD
LKPPRKRWAVLRRATVLSVLCAFVILAVVFALNLSRHFDSPEAAVPIQHEPPPSKEATPKIDSPPGAQPSPGGPREPAPVHPSVAPPDIPSSTEGGSHVTDADLNYLAARNLLIPVAGVKAGQLRDTFNEARSEGRIHDAIDIMAPQGTPVLATADGVVIKLFQSDKGGTTLYQQDPSGHYVYYYAHLMRYADAIAEGKPLRRGDVIAYVGDTGNAGAGNFHLHFAISKVSSPQKWSGGEPINPYPLLSGS